MATVNVYEPPGKESLAERRKWTKGLRTVATRRRLLIVMLLLCVFLFLGACTVDLGEVRDTFAREHPNYSLEDAFVGDGDGDTAYVHIRYRKPGDPKGYEEAWMYRRQGRRWNRIRKLAPSVISSGP